MGTIDLHGGAEGDESDGTCDWSVWGTIGHAIVDVVMLADCDAQIQQCLRDNGIPSGSPGPGVTDDQVRQTYQMCHDQHCP